MKQQKIDEIKARCDRATRGPWLIKPDNLGYAPYIVTKERTVSKVFFSGGSEDG